jgi:hypothetical protein
VGTSVNSIGVLELTDEEVDQVYAKYIHSAVKPELKEIDLEYLTLSPRALNQILQLYANLHNLTIGIHHIMKQMYSQRKTANTQGNSNSMHVASCSELMHAIMPTSI